MTIHLAKDKDSNEKLGLTRWRELTSEERAAFIQRGDDYGLYDTEIEQAVLGAILSNNQAYWACISQDLRPEHFYYGNHQLIFSVIREMIEEGGDANPVTLRHRINDEAIWDEIGEQNYLVTLAVASVAVINIPQYAGIMKDLHARRRLFRVYEDAINDLRYPEDPGQIHRVVTQTFGKAMDEADCVEGGVSINSHDKVTKKVIASMDEDLPCIPTGIDCFDRTLRGGIFAKKSYCIAAKPKAGKTTMLGTIFKNMTSAGHRALFIAGEMGEEEIHCRNMARELQRNSLAFYTHRKDQAFVGDVLDYDKNSQGNPGFYCDVANITFDQLKQAYMIAVQKHKVQVIFLDYIGLVEGRDQREPEAMFQHRVTKWIAQAAKRYGVPCVYAAQLNREGHIRGSDGAVMNADAVFHLHKEGKKAWMDCLAMRYAPRANIGSQENPALIEVNKGPYFEDIGVYQDQQDQFGREYDALADEIGF